MCKKSSPVELDRPLGTVQALIEGQKSLDFLHGDEGPFPRLTLTHHPLLLVGQIKEEKPPQPELSRAEYLHLLHTAKALGNEKVYLLIKLFACTGFFVKELPNLTVEAVRGTFSAAFPASSP